MAQFKNKQRLDIAIYNYRDENKFLFDVTITHPLAKRSISSSCSKPGFAAAEKEREKRLQIPCNVHKSWVLSLSHCLGGIRLLGKQSGGDTRRTIKVVSFMFRLKTQRVQDALEKENSCLSSKGQLVTHSKHC